MKIFSNYKFYLIIAYTITLIVYNVCQSCGIIVSESFILNIMSYILSMLIAYNVITINSNKSADEIKQDLEDISNTINSETNEENVQDENNDETQETNLCNETNVDKN